MDCAFCSEKAKNSGGLFLSTPNSVTLPCETFFQQALDLPGWTGHPNEETSIPNGRGELAALTLACRESCHTAV